MQPGLVAGDESSTKRHALRAELDRAGEPGSVTDAARGKHGKGLKRSHRIRKQFPDRRCAAHVASRLNALSEDSVGAGLRRPFGLVDRADLHQHLHSVAMCDWDIRRRVSPEENDRRGAHRGDAFHVLEVLRHGRVVDDDIDAERSISQRAGPRHQFAHRLVRHPTSAEDPEASGVRHRRRQLGARGRADAGVEDRVADAEQVAQGRVQGPHWSIMQCGVEGWEGVIG